VKSILGPSSGVLRSDTESDAQLIIVVTFREGVKLRGIRFLATEAKTEQEAESSGPAVVKLFLGRPNYSFSDCEAERPTDVLKLTKAQIESGEEVKVQYVKFSGNVTSLTLFIESNQEDSRTSASRARATTTLAGGVLSRSYHLLRFIMCARAACMYMRR
jgi:hypothetical protein